jgi:hypothetical protein
MATPGGGTFLNPLFQVISFGAGTAMGPVLRPVLQDLANETWTAHPVRPPDVYTLASGVAQGQVADATARAWAKQSGFGDAQFSALVDIANVGPGAAYAFELWRRNVIDEAGFRRALKRLGLEAEWMTDLVALRNVLLTPAELAQARQRGFIDQARQYQEANLQGVTDERAEIQFKSAGLPPPTERALSMWRRGIINEAEFKQTIVEGNEKLKYQDEEAALFRALLTPGQIVNQHLRGWRSFAWMEGRLADYGYNAEDSLDLFQGQGRPISTRQVFIGQRRGGRYNGPTADIDPAILKQLEESNIRPEWYDLADAQKESYPSAFVIRGLATSGALDPAQTRRVLMEIGWPVWLIDAVVTFWTGATAGAPAAGPRVKSAQTSAITEIRSAFLIGQADEAQARDWLGRIGVDGTEIDGVLPIWHVMREIPQKGLTASQIRKAYKSLPAQWPRARALDELQLLGLTPDDAATILDE